MPLSDLIHQVPRLLELMPSECLAALIATNTTHRSQVHSYVTSITLSDTAHASLLISCSWPRLVKWTLADQDSHRLQTIRVTFDMTVAAASVLAKASVLSMWHLQLEGTQLSAAVAAEIAKGDCRINGTVLLACQADKGSCAGAGGSQLASIDLVLIC